ncbi:hypothetical protein IQ07DRAFT_667637 [Pyrenochaeta sp. DS3sAY3a]|nr:hypothetical protein IQ07DRAFT_667637 [Pyrenochaeta sp. DS3sAY3a]
MNRKACLALHTAKDHVIASAIAETVVEAILDGELECCNIPTNCQVRVELVRVGRIIKGGKSKHATATKALISELGFLGSAKDQRTAELDYASAEKISESVIIPTPGSKSKCAFRLDIPTHLPPTVELSSVRISYSVVATCDPGTGKLLQSSKPVNIIRQTPGPVNLEPSQTVVYPESPLAIQARFQTLSPSAKRLNIPVALQLHGMLLPPTESMHNNESRWLVPREIRWELEETAVLITGSPDSTGQVPMATAQKVLKKQQLSAGKEKLKLKYPFTRAGNTVVRMLEEEGGMEIPINVMAPADTDLSDGRTLSIAGAHILHTVRDCANPLSSSQAHSRFAVYLEYKLHIWVRTGEDVFDNASGDLMNRKVDEMAYTILCPLNTQRTPRGDGDAHGDEEPATIVPPRYEGGWIEPPPEYATYS